MNGDPSLEYQGAIVTALKGDATLAVMIGTRVVDEPKQNIAFPYVRIGSSQSIDEGHDCGDDAVECIIDIHCWSRRSASWQHRGRTGAKRVASAVKAALHTVVLDLGSDWVMVEHHCQTVRDLMEPDDKTAHSVLSFRALIDPA